MGEFKNVIRFTVPEFHLDWKNIQRRRWNNRNVIITKSSRDVKYAAGCEIYHWTELSKFVAIFAFRELEVKYIPLLIYRSFLKSRKKKRVSAL